MDSKRCWCFGSRVERSVWFIVFLLNICVDDNVQGSSIETRKAIRIPHRLQHIFWSGSFPCRRAILLAFAAASGVCYYKHPLLPLTVYTQASNPNLPKNIPALITESLRACDPELRQVLMGNVVLTGGGSLFSGFTDRLSTELSRTFPHVRCVRFVDLTAAHSSLDEDTCPWQPCRAPIRWLVGG